MKLKLKPSLIFESETLSQEVVVDALFFFSEKLLKLGLKPSAIFPAEPYSLPLAMILSDKLLVPIKGEGFLKPDDKVLLLFSFFPFGEVSEDFIYERLLLFRELYPDSPSLLVASPNPLTRNLDFQLLVAPLERLYSNRFLSEASKNFFWPVKGEVNYFSPELWELSKKEAKNFLRAKRIRDSVRKYLSEEEVVRLKLIDSEVELSLWERFKKSIFTPLEKPKRPEKLELKVEKLFQVKDKVLNSAITSILEFLAQSLEFHFPVNLAYSNYEVVERDGVLIVPSVKEEVSGADLTVEFRLKSGSDEDIEKLALTVKSAVKEIGREILKGEAFKPHYEWNVDKKLGKFTLYLSWFIDKEMALKVYRKTNKEWLLSRILARKRLKGELLDFLKFLREFTLNLDNLESLKVKFPSLYLRNPKLFEMKGREVKEILDEKGLWPLIAYLCVSGSFPKELCSFLMELKGFSSPHQLLAYADCYITPVKSRRLLRGYWERVKREGKELFIKGEPLNPNSPTTFVVQTEDGELLGTIPPVIAHYLTAKERSGKKLKLTGVFVEPEVYTENSYWLEIRCL
ncbi:hypothetical protein [Thermovibrio sp.]